MNDKYYVPKIEEFGVGFEYELNRNKKWVKKCWTDNISLSIPTIKELCEAGNIRVKCLDKTDLVELGFTKIENDLSDNIDNYILGNQHENHYSLTILGKDDIYISYCFKHYATLKGEKVWSWDSYVSFRGKILNKSELKWFLEKLDLTPAKIEKIENEEKGVKYKWNKY